MTILFVYFVVALTLVLCLLHTKAVDGALSEMKLLRLLSHNRLSAVTIIAAIALLLVNVVVQIPLITGLVFIPIAAMWLIRTIQAAKESKQRTGKTDLKYTYQKMFNDRGEEIDAEAIEAFIDGCMEDLNAQIDELENSLSDEQRGLIEAEFDDMEESEESGEEEGEGRGSDKEGDYKEGDKDSQEDFKYHDDSFAFNPGDKVEVISVPSTKFPNELIGTKATISLRLPNISLVHGELDGHGYFINGYTLPAECLRKVS